jgi:hypothetical protein
LPVPAATARTNGKSVTELPVRGRVSLELAQVQRGVPVSEFADPIRKLDKLTPIGSVGSAYNLT